MSITIGNSGAPRWYDCDFGRFQEYIEHIREAGANATEIVLHDGPADTFTSRVHVLREHWDEVIRAYRDAGIEVYLHGSLTPAFALHHWFEDRQGLTDRYDPIIRTLAEVTNDQGRSTLVIHGAAHPDHSVHENELATVGFLSVIEDRLDGLSGRAGLAIELRAGKTSRPTAAATSRDSVTRIVQELDGARIGICWDVAHDVENAEAAASSWTFPDQAFFDRVTHVHVHDLGDDGEAHCPPVYGRVPIAGAVETCADKPAIMEIRWRMAERVGEPWDVLAESYQTVLGDLRDLEENGATSVRTRTPQADR